METTNKQFVIDTNKIKKLIKIMHEVGNISDNIEKVAKWKKNKNKRLNILFDLGKINADCQTAIFNLENAVMELQEISYKQITS